MTRTTIPFQAPDISSLARALRSQLIGRETTPGHVEILNILARAVGRRNFQQLRAEAEGARPVERPADAPPAPAVDLRRVERVQRCFSPEGRLLRWPSRREDQVLALWGLWAQIPSRRDFTEQEISQVLKTLHDFGDHALLRRAMVDMGYVARTPDGRIYRRIEQKPPSGNSAVPELAREGVDTLVTGELREEWFNRAQEEKLNLYLCGHYATEVHAVRALAAELAKKFRLPWEWVATENPL